jgi:hypothetical protein
MNGKLHTLGTSPPGNKLLALSLKLFTLCILDQYICQLLPTKHTYHIHITEQLYSENSWHEYPKHVEAHSTFRILDGSQTLPGHCRNEEENFLPLPENRTV